MWLVLPAMRGMGRFTRDLTNDINYLGRAVVSFDVRTQTEYGTLRSYMRVGWQVPTPGATGAGTTALGYWDRAFIQFAGFTVGRAQSFFDVFTNTGKFTYSFTRMNGDTDITGRHRLGIYSAVRERLFDICLAGGPGIPCSAGR